MEADKAPARASVILAGLGFEPGSQTRPTRYVFGLIDQYESDIFSC